MKILEIRRHSVRSQSGDHLNQMGVSLARAVGQGIGPFHRVVTSTLPRAFETAIAMGFAVDEQSKIMSTYGSYNVDREVPWPQSFAAYSDAVRGNGAAAKYARKLVKYYQSVLDLIPEGRAALAINHGGVVELGAASCLPDTNLEPWGGPVDYCEGARLYWDDGKFVKGEVLRVSI